MIDFKRFRIAIDRKNVALFALEKARARATKVTTTITGMPRGTSTGKQVEDGAIRIAEAEEALEARTQELKLFQDELTRMLSAMKDERQKKYLSMRYLEEMSVPKIAIRESYSESTIYDELKRAELLLNSTLYNKP